MCGHPSDRIASGAANAAKTNSSLAGLVIVAKRSTARNMAKNGSRSNNRSVVASLTRLDARLCRPSCPASVVDDPLFRRSHGLGSKSVRTEGLSRSTPAEDSSGPSDRGLATKLLSGLTDLARYCACAGATCSNSPVSHRLRTLSAAYPPDSSVRSSPATRIAEAVRIAGACALVAARISRVGWSPCRAATRIARSIKVGSAANASSARLMVRTHLPSTSSRPPQKSYKSPVRTSYIMPFTVKSRPRALTRRRRSHLCRCESFSRASFSRIESP